MEPSSPKQSKSVARDLVLTVCPIKSSGKPAPLCGHSLNIIENRVYLLGGRNEEKFSTDSFVFNIGSLKWETLKTTGSSPGPLFGHSVANRGLRQLASSPCFLGTQLYVFGGLCPAQTFTFPGAPPPSAPKPAGPRTQSSLFRTRLFKFIGEEETTNGLYVLDTRTNAWTALAAPAGKEHTPSRRFYHSACVVDAYLIVFGGNRNSAMADCSDDLLVYHMDKNEWFRPEAKGNGPSRRYGHTATHVGGGRMLVFGGVFEDQEAGKFVRYNDVHILDTKTWSWSVPEIVGSLPLCRAFHTAGLVGGGVEGQAPLLHVFAGETSSTADLCVLNLETMRWARPLFDGNFEHVMHASVVVSDKMLVFGGLSSTGTLLNDFFFANTVTIHSGVTEKTFKLVLVGDSGVGKSCLMTRFVEDRYSDVHFSTIGVDFKTVTTMLEGKIIKMHIWDTAGQERFAQVTQHYYRSADGAVLVYDMTNPTSFGSIERWMDAVEGANGVGEVEMLLVANKADLTEARQVPAERAQELAKKIGAPFVETSAMDSRNVDVAFLNLAKKLVHKREKKAAESRVKLDGTGSTAPRSAGCCK